MTCEEIQVRLLTADEPAAAARETDVAAHLASCADCTAVLAKLERVEAAARSLPEPTVAASASRVAFLNRLESLESTSAAPLEKARVAGRIVRSRAYRLIPRVAAAAAVLLLLVSGIWVLTGDVPSADASSAVVGQLVEWNLNLAQAGTPEERKEIFASAVGPLKLKVARARMQPEDQELARKLLDNGKAMAANEDPIDDVERLNDTADLLLKRIQIATSRGNMRAVRAFSYNYALLQAASGNPLQKLEPPVGEDPQRFERLEQMIRHDADLRKRLQALLERSPNATKQEILEQFKRSKPRSPKGTTRPAAHATTRPAHPNHPELREDRPAARRENAKPPVILTPEQQEREQQQRERRVREWFREFKKRDKNVNAATTAPSLIMPSLGIPSDLD